MIDLMAAILDFHIFRSETFSIIQDFTNALMKQCIIIKYSFNDIIS